MPGDARHVAPAIAVATPWVQMELGRGRPFSLERIPRFRVRLGLGFRTRVRFRVRVRVKVRV